MLGRYELDVRHLRSALELSRAVYGEQHPVVARNLYYMAAGLGYTDTDKAEPLFRQAIEMMRATDPQNINLPYMMQDLGGVLLGKADSSAADREAARAAEPLHREALELFRRHYGDEHLTVAASYGGLSYMYEVLGDFERAEAFALQAVERYRRLSNQHLLAPTLALLTRIKIRKGEYAAAEALQREAVELTRQFVGENHRDFAGHLDLLAQALMLKGEYAEAETLVKQGLTSLQRSIPGENTDAASLWLLLGKTMTRTRRLSGGEIYLRRALETYRRQLKPAHWKIGEAQSALGENLLAQRRYAEAEALLVAGHASLNSRFGHEDYRTREAARSLNALRQASGQTPHDAAPGQTLPADAR